MKRRRNQRGVAFVEFALLFPLFMMIVVASVDLGRLIYWNQVVVNVGREAAAMASRGASDTETINAMLNADAPIDLSATGCIIITTVERHSAADATPWVTDQTVSGPLSFTSRVGSVNAAATLPGITQVDQGLIFRVIEVAQAYTPILPADVFGMSLYPTVIYDRSTF